MSYTLMGGTGDPAGTAAAAVAAHEADTTNVHGVADTSLLETATGAQTKATAAQTAAIAASAQRASNLSDLASASTARTNLGLGGAATLAVGATAGTVAAGDDIRLVTGISNLLTVGEESHSRDLIASVILGGTSGFLRLCHFTARKSETTTQVRLSTGGTAAAATPTICRIGLYSIAGNGDATLVASTANDTALFAAASTQYTKSWSTPYAKVAGQRYAIGPLVVTATTAPTFAGQLVVNGTEALIAPAICTVTTGLTDLPSSIASGSLGGNGHRIYAAILP